MIPETKLILMFCFLQHKKNTILKLTTYYIPKTEHRANNKGHDNTFFLPATTAAKGIRKNKKIKELKLKINMKCTLGAIKISCKPYIKKHKKYYIKGTEKC